MIWPHFFKSQVFGHCTDRTNGLCRAKLYTLQFTILYENKTKLQVKMSMHYLLGVKVRNMKIDFNIYGTWRRVGQ